MTAILERSGLILPPHNAQPLYDSFDNEVSAAQRAFGAKGRYEHFISNVSNNEHRYAISRMQQFYTACMNESGFGESVAKGEIKKVRVIIPGASPFEILGMKFAAEMLGAEQIDFLWYDLGPSSSKYYENITTSLIGESNENKWKFQGSTITFSAQNAAKDKLHEEADAIPADATIFFAGNTGPHEYGATMSWSSVLNNWAQYIVSKHQPSLFIETATRYDGSNVMAIFNNVIDNSVIDNFQPFSKISSFWGNNPYNFKNFSNDYSHDYVYAASAYIPKHNSPQPQAA